MEELAIKIEHVKKEYRLGAIGGGTLKGDLESWWARVRGKEDPNSKVDADPNLKIGERFLALDDINFEIKKGEAVGIIGHNGAGKSTLLKLLSRVTAPTEGKISIDGRIASMLEVGTGFHGELTGRENVYMNGAILGMTRAEIDKKFDEIVEFSEVAKFIDTPVKRYSSGMYVKLAFSVAAHLDSEIMIMDEVLAVGDMAFQKKCLTKMREAAKVDGRTVLYVSHNMNTIRQLCDRCIVMDHGHIIYDGDVEHAISLYLGAESEDELSTFFSYKEKARDYHFGKQVKINTFRFVGKEQAIYEVGEAVNFEIEFESRVDVEGAQLVLSLKTGNLEQIGMALSKTFDLHAGCKQRVIFTPNLGMLTDDKYCIAFEVIKVDEFGNYFSYDNPKARVFFEYKSEFGLGIKWNKQWWANVMFPNYEAISVSD